MPENSLEQDGLGLCGKKSWWQGLGWVGGGRVGFVLWGCTEAMEENKLDWGGCVSCGEKGNYCGSSTLMGRVDLGVCWL